MDDVLDSAVKLTCIRIAEHAASRLHGSRACCAAALGRSLQRRAGKQRCDDAGSAIVACTDRVHHSHTACMTSLV